MVVLSITFITIWSINGRKNCKTNRYTFNLKKIKSYLVENILLDSTTVLFGEDYRDISDYLIKKNPKIIVDEIINNKKIDIFRIVKR